VKRQGSPSIGLRKAKDRKGRYRKDLRKESGDVSHPGKAKKGRKGKGSEKESWLRN